MADSLTCHWCGATMTMVWIRHACVVQGERIYNPTRGWFANDRQLPDGLYVHCGVCTQFSAFEPAERTHP